MYEIGPANGGKITRLPSQALPHPLSNSSTCDRQSTLSFPQSDTSVRQHMFPANDSGGKARPSSGTLTSSNDAAGIEDSFRLVNIYCHMRHFFLLITELKRPRGSSW